MNNEEKLALFQQFAEWQQHQQAQRAAAASPVIQRTFEGPIPNIKEGLERIPACEGLECPAIDLSFAGYFAAWAKKKDDNLVNLHLELASILRILACSAADNGPVDLAFHALRTRLRDITKQRRVELAASTNWPVEIKRLASNCEHVGPELFGPEFIKAYKGYLSRRDLDLRIAQSLRPQSPANNNNNRANNNANNNNNRKNNGNNNNNQQQGGGARNNSNGNGNGNRSSGGNNSNNQGSNTGTATPN